ncbi:MAG: acyl carrier protein [Alphaproteobacteria bacterium]
MKSLLGQALQLGGRANELEASSRLLGGLPELDSFAVVTVIAALEERFDIRVHDEEITAETFASVASLSDFVERKRRKAA